MKSEERWSLCPHRNDASSDERDAIEFLERLLPARWRLAQEGKLAYPALDFPLNASMLKRWFGYGWKRCYRIRRAALAFLETLGTYVTNDQSHAYLIFRLKPSLEQRLFKHVKPQADLSEILLSAKEVLSRVFSPERGPP